ERTAGLAASSNIHSGGLPAHAPGGALPRRSCRGLAQQAAGLGLEYANKLNRRDGRGILRAFRVGQLSFGAFVREFFQTGLHVGRGMEVNQMPGYFGREAFSTWAQKRVKDRGW